MKALKCICDWLKAWLDLKFMFDRFYRIKYWFSFFCFLSTLFCPLFTWVACPASKPPLIQVKVFSKHKLYTLILNSTHGFIIEIEKFGSGKKEAIKWPADKSVIVSLNKGAIQILEDLPIQAKSLQITPLNQGHIFIKSKGIPKKKLHDNVTILRRGDALQLITESPLENYVATVLSSELPNNFPIETLKAQAVLIRTLALHNDYPHIREGFHFCDTTHCQLFQPLNHISNKFRHAVEQTQGQILTFKRKPIVALYHSTCGGSTSSNQTVFGGPHLPYLKGIKDKDVNKNNYCSASPHSRWKASFTLKEIQKLWPEYKFKSIDFLDEDKDGRIEQVLFQGETPTFLLAQNFLLHAGRFFGWNRLKSAHFKVEKKDNTLFFKGKGLGHGVGLCQWGARGLALAGHNYREILKHYFPHTHLEQWN